MSILKGKSASVPGTRTTVAMVEVEFPEDNPVLLEMAIAAHNAWASDRFHPCRAGWSTVLPVVGQVYPAWKGTDMIFLRKA